VQLDYLDDECRQHFDQVCNYLNGMGIAYTVNPTIVRGLDYYTNTAFEVVYEGLGAQNSLAGGGRYNGLIEQVGGKPIPAIGFAGGFERLLLALEEEKITLGNLPEPMLFFILMGSSARDMALPLINYLRGKGIYVDYDPDKNSLKAQFKAADSSKAKYAVIIGEDEVARNQMNLKNLATGEQQTLPLSDPEALLHILG